MALLDRLSGLVLLGVFAAPRFAQGSAGWKDPSPHAVRFVSVTKDVRLEVLDWGGSGSPMVLLAGGGLTAHVFDNFAPKLTFHHHVYGITRRGFGASGYSAEHYDADRMGDDVVAVLDALKVKRAILVGHSLAGEELSSIANHHRERVAALVYLDAAYAYAFDNGKGSTMDEMRSLQGPQFPQPGAKDLASFEAFQRYDEGVHGFRLPDGELRQQRETTPEGGVGKQREFPGFATLMQGMKKYDQIPAPSLIIFANPHGLGTWIDRNTDPSVRAAAEKYSAALRAMTEKQEKAVAAGVPGARVVTLAGADHLVFISNEADVLREMNRFFADQHLQ
jgi:non-heme chloroperoxidase